jgi:hypothetical protein
MTEEPGGALVHLTVSEPLPLDVPAGDGVAVTARASCPDGRDRTGMAITITAPDGEAATLAFAVHADGVSETAVITLTAPPRLGLHAFRFTLPAHEIAGTQYAQAVLDVPVRVTPQATNLAVWDVPSPVVADTRFVIKAGAKSAANATLARCAIEVCDEAGEVAGRGVLSDAPLPGTGALYWTDIPLQAPPTEGVATWTARFEASELDLPHDGAQTTFSVAVVRPPEHVLSVKVIEQATAAPIPDVELRLGAYRGTTGASGLAEIALPKGRYELRIWKVGFEAPPRPVELDADAFVEIEALVVPEEDPDARWRM